MVIVQRTYHTAQGKQIVTCVRKSRRLGISIHQELAGIHNARNCLHALLGNFDTCGELSRKSLHAARDGLEVYQKASIPFHLCYGVG